MNPGNFFAELNRRNVYKVAVAYAVVKNRLRTTRRSALAVIQMRVTKWVRRGFDPREIIVLELDFFAF